MSISGWLHGRKAYLDHINGNKLSGEEKVKEADAKYRSALANYAKAAADKNCAPMYLEAYSVLLMRFQRFDEAMELIRRADKITRQKADKQKLRVNYSICLWKKGKLDQAIELMKSVFQDRKMGTIYGSLGYMLIEKAEQTGDFTEAEAFNKEAMTYDDEDAVILDNMGQMYLRMGRPEEALPFFEKAHKFNPKQVDTLYYLGKLYHEAGRDEEAKEILDHAVIGNYSALCTTTREMAVSLRESIR
ncbi:MAG: tetratricopeptide repeat protein [Clostridia bacterium]|nr:tetratricopeptide repeat protein [Clostridia bacterium]